MIVSYGQFSGGSEVQNFFLTVDGEDQSALHSFQWGVLHKAPQNNFHWGASFHFMANHTEQSSLSHIFFSPEFYYTLFQQKKIELLLSGAINLGFLTNITIKNNSDGEPNAWPLGFDFGVKSLVHFHPKWDVLLGLSYRYLKIIDAKDIQYADGSELILNSSNGIGFQLGLLYKF